MASRSQGVADETASSCASRRPRGYGFLDKLRLACRDASVGAQPVETVATSCAVPLVVMQDCRRRKLSFPDAHEWRPALADENGPWFQCKRCLEVTRVKP